MLDFLLLYNKHSSKNKVILALLGGKLISILIRSRCQKKGDFLSKKSMILECTVLITNKKRSSNNKCSHHNSSSTSV